MPHNDGTRRPYRCIYPPCSLHDGVRHLRYLSDMQNICLFVIDMLQFVLIGLITGITIGTVGIGSGILLIPLLVYSGLTIHNAIAIGLLMQLLPQSIPGVYMYSKKGHLPLYEGLLVVLGNVVGISIGSYLVNYGYVSEKLMYYILFGILFFSLIYIGNKILTF